MEHFKGRDFSIAERGLELSTGWKGWKDFILGIKFLIERMQLRDEFLSKGRSVKSSIYTGI